MFFRDLMTGGASRFGGAVFDADGPTSPSPPPAPPPPPPAAPPPPPKTEGAQMFSREYVQELREENKTVRLKNQEIETARQQVAEQLAQAKKDAEDAIKAAKEEARAAGIAAKTAADERIIKVELKAEATKAGIVNFDDMLKLADLSTVKIDEKTGDVVGAVEMLKALKEAKPYLFGDAPGTSGITPPPKPGTNVGKTAKDMTPAEQAAKLAEIRRKFA